jgi:TerC family integral membrane protein
MNYHETIWFFGIIALVLFILLLDLGIFSKKSHVVGFKEALSWTIVWISLGVGFYFVLKYFGHHIHGISDMESLKNITKQYHESINFNGLSEQEALRVYNKKISLEYITGYLIEYSLSVDNVFVMILIFTGFGVRQKHFKKILFWGILGAIIMRFLFIFISAALIHQFAWILYVFGAFLVFTGIKLFIDRNKNEKISTQKHPVVKFASKFFRVFPRFVGDSFVIKKQGKRYITPMLLVLLVIEFTDVVFAVDSVPAIFSITQDPFIVFFSNLFAIIGLRSLFFLVMNVVNLFRYLKIGLSVLLSFIGLKMLFHNWLEDIGFTTAHSLYIILGILLVSILLSIIIQKKEEMV